MGVPSSFPWQQDGSVSYMNIGIGLVWVLYRHRPCMGPVSGTPLLGLYVYFVSQLCVELPHNYVIYFCELIYLLLL